MTRGKAWAITSIAILLTAMGFVVPVAAHVGSPDVFVETSAGPYRLLVTVRPPRVIPGSAEVEILAPPSGVTRVLMVPTPLTGAASRFAPTPQVAARTTNDTRLYTGDLWMMTAGAWEVRITVEGDQGTGTVAVPVPTLPQATLAMNPMLGAGLVGLMVLLAAGLVAIVAAMAREASLEPGATPTTRARRSGRVAAVITAIVVVAILWCGRAWWNVEASAYARYVYKPLEATALVSPAGALTMSLQDPGWIALRRLDDFVPDHGHVMHFFVVSPALDRFWHLHPALDGDATFGQTLPTIPAGKYEFFADVVHESGIAETATGRLEVPVFRGMPPMGDDSAWSAEDTPIAAGNVARLRDGGRMIWVRDRSPLHHRDLTVFTFRIEDAGGEPATDLELYMGMPGHAVFIRRDRAVFAHVHPQGSAPMATMEIGQRSLGASGSTEAGASGLRDTHVMPSMAGSVSTLPPTVSFPFGFPQPGEYRIFVQIKRHGNVETGVFDASVD